MANLRTEYAIEIVKRGTGAPEAVKDLQSVQAAAVSTNAATTAISTNAVATGTQFVANASKMRQAASALSGELRLLGFIAFPQFAQQTAVAGLALNSTAASAKILGVSSIALGGGLVALGGSIWIIVERLRMWKAELRDVDTRLELVNANQRLLATLQRSIVAAQVTGTLSFERGSQLLTALQEMTKLNDPGAASKGLHEIARELEDINAVTEGAIELRHRLTLATTEGLAHRKAEIEFDHQAILKEIADEEKRTGIRREDLVTQALIARTGAVYNAEREATAQKQKVWDQIHSDSMTAEAYQLDQLTQQYTKQKQAIVDLVYQAGLSTTEQIKMEAELEIAIGKATEKLKAQQFAASEWGRVATGAAQNFASGFSSAVVGAFSEGGDAFRKFAQQFLQQMAQMLIQAVVLRAIFSGLGGGALGTAITGLTAAQGGIYPRQMAAGGIAGVGLASSPVYLPRFNVQAGEAGPEWLTVLRAPRMMQVGGVRAAVGFAGNEELALSRAGDLRGAGAGGTIVIEVAHSPETEVRITRNSVQGAVVQINNNLRQDTDTSRAVKGLVT